MIEQLEAYAKSTNASDEVLGWLKTTGAKFLKKASAGSRQSQAESDLEHILDYLISPAAPKRLQKLSVTDAKRKAKEWSDRNQRKGRGLVDTDADIETIHDFLDGTKIVRLKTKSAMQREGFLMSHCAGGYVPENADCHIYSYRDAKNMPHATFEVRKNNNEIVQIKGKGNGPIHPRYIHPILAFLQTIGMQVRPSDMRNLGYYHIERGQLELFKLYEGAEEQMVVIAGESYAF